MKKKIIATLLALISTNSFAAVGHDYKILREEIHSAPGFNFQVKEVAPGTAAAFQKKNSLSGNTRTSVPSRNGRISQSIEVDGYHDFSIYNNTKQTQTYEMNTSLDCDAMHSYYTRYIEIYAGGSYSRSDHSYGTVQESRPGTYRISAETSLKGESSHSSRDSNNLYVSN